MEYQEHSTESYRESERPRRRIRPRSLVWPVLLIGLGVILLLNNLGYLRWNVWATLVRFWPVLIIAWGVELLLGQRSWLGNIVAGLLLIAVLVGVVVFGQSLSVGRQEVLAINEPLRDFETARVDIGQPVGSLELQAATNSETFVEGSLSYPAGYTVSVDSQMESGEANFSLKSSGSGSFSGLDETWEWTLNFTPEVEFKKFIVSMAVGDMDLDLRDLQVKSLTANLGIGKMLVELPDAATMKGNVDMAIGDLVIEAPEGVGLRIYTDTALVNRTLPTGYRSLEDGYVSPNYDDAETRIDLEVNLALGSLTVR